MQKLRIFRLSSRAISVTNTILANQNWHPTSKPYTTVLNHLLVRHVKSSLVDVTIWNAMKKHIGKELHTIVVNVRQNLCRSKNFSSMLWCMQKNALCGPAKCVTQLFWKKIQCAGTCEVRVPEFTNVFIARRSLQRVKNVHNVKRSARQQAKSFSFVKCVGSNLYIEENGSNVSSYIATPKVHCVCVRTVTNGIIIRRHWNAKVDFTERSWKRVSIAFIVVRSMTILANGKVQLKLWSCCLWVRQIKTVSEIETFHIIQSTAYRNQQFLRYIMCVTSCICSQSWSKNTCKTSQKLIPTSLHNCVSMIGNAQFFFILIAETITETRILHQKFCEEKWKQEHMCNNSKDILLEGNSILSVSAKTFKTFKDEETLWNVIYFQHCVVEKCGKWQKHWRYPGLASFIVKLFHLFRVSYDKPHRPKTCQTSYFCPFFSWELAKIAKKSVDCDILKIRVDFCKTQKIEAEKTRFTVFTFACSGSLSFIHWTCSSSSTLVAAPHPHLLLPLIHTSCCPSSTFVAAPHPHTTRI